MWYTVEEYVSCDLIYILHHSDCHGIRWRIIHMIKYWNCLRVCRMRKIGISVEGIMVFAGFFFVVVSFGIIFLVNAIDGNRQRKRMIWNYTFYNGVNCVWDHLRKISKYMSSSGSWYEKKRMFLSRLRFFWLSEMFYSDEHSNLCLFESVCPKEEIIWMISAGDDNDLNRKKYRYNFINIYDRHSKLFHFY